MLVKDIMTTSVITVTPKTPLVSAARLMFQKNFNGLPVVNADNRLLGLVTRQNLILHTSSLHLPTLIKLLSDLKIYKKDDAQIKNNLKQILSLNVSGIMNHEPLTVTGEEPIAKVANIFANHHAIDPIPVIGQDGKIQGVISRYDILKFFVGSEQRQGHTTIETGETTTIIDADIDHFVNEFQSRFLLINRTRAHAWLWLSVSFAILGFVVAWFMILRIA